MLEAKKYSFDGNEAGNIKLSKELFAVETKNPNALFYEVVNLYRANQRQGNASVKNRSMVHGSGRKLYRQKGTGNARAGDAKTPLRVGGGNAFGPKKKDWYKKIPKKKKKLALKVALSEKAKDNKIAIVTSLDFNEPDTKKASTLLDKIVSEKRKVLILMNDSNENTIRSFANITWVKTDRADCVYPYEVLNANYLIISEKALTKMQEVFVK